MCLTEAAALLTSVVKFGKFNDTCIQQGHIIFSSYHLQYIVACIIDTV